MQNINGKEAETFQGFDFQSFQYEDFPLIPPNDFIVVNSQTAITDNSHTALAMNHLNPQNREFSACWNSSIAGDEIFENFSNLINLREQIPASHLIISDVKFTSDVNKVDDVAVISKEEFIQKENEEPKKRAAQRNEMHNQTEKNRRNAIKDKINTLRKLLPDCNKTDQASILGDVVDYVKCLQCQHQMLSMAYMPYMPMGMGMGIGMGMVNMCGQFAGGACLPFPSVTLTHPTTPSLPVFTDSNIVSHSQFKPPSAPLPPVTFDSAQVFPTANTTFGINPLVQPLIPYAINHAQQGESSSSQYNTNGITMDYNQMYQLQAGDEYKLMANCEILPHSGP